MGKNIINKSNSKSFFVRRKGMFLLTGATIVSLVPVTSSVAISTNTTLNSINSGAYGLGNMNFGSYNELMNYVNNNSKTVSVEGNNSKWTVTLNGVTKSYSDPNTLRQSLYNDYIKSKQVKTDVDLATYASSNGVLGLTSQKVWKHVSYDVNSSNIVYQGANDQIFANQEDAYASYFQTKQGYTFNGVNFNDKASLRTYLEREYFPNKANLQNTVVITSPTGNSLPINLTRTDAYETLTNFINENAEIRLNYTNKSDESVSIKINNISDTMNAVELKDLNYQHVHSNEGESRYIIDNNDSADLIGPYFYKGVLDVTSFKNKKMWKKVNGVAKSVYVESQLDSTIGSFFTSIINDDNNLNKIQAEDGSTNTLLFRTLLSTPDNKSYDKWFIEELGKLSPDLANAVIKANDSMMTGKKYNSFYKILRKEFYYAYDPTTNSEGLDIKGVGEYGIYQCESFINLLCDIFNLVLLRGPKIALHEANIIYRNFMSKTYPIEFYRRLDSHAKFDIDIKSEFSKFQSDMLGEEDKYAVDTSYNGMILRTVIGYLTENIIH